MAAVVLPNMAKYFAMLFCSLLSLNMMVANPIVIPRWHDPCGGSKPIFSKSSLIFPKFKLSSNHGHFRDLLSLTTEAMGFVEALVMEYESDRFGYNADFIESLENVHVDGMPRVDDLKLDDMDKPVLKLKESYKRLAITSVFLDEVKKDEIEAEYVHTSYESKIEELESKIYRLQCRILQALKDNNEHIDRTISEEVVSTDYTNTAQRYGRDYIIFRDVYKILQFSASQFRGLKRHSHKSS